MQRLRNVPRIRYSYIPKRLDLATCEQELDIAWKRAVHTTFLVSEIHPFDDGNGRIARIMMDAELVPGNQARIIIQTVFRDDYLGGLRRFTKEDYPSVPIKTLRFTHDYTADIDFTDATSAVNQL